jgi:hypothetical protein
MAKLTRTICAWDGCEASFSEMLPPKGWTDLLLLVGGNSPPDLHQIVAGDGVLRDCCLCPAHSAELQSKLKSEEARHG